MPPTSCWWPAAGGFSGLLECLDLHGGDVADVRITKVTVDVEMERPC